MAIYNKWFDLPEIDADPFTSYAQVISNVLTMISLINKHNEVISESEALQEQALTYLMSKMTSNSRWIPYQQLIVDRKLRSCVNFGKVSIQYPCDLSIVTSFYKSIKFEFSDVTMKTLIFDLNAWIKNSSEVELSELKKNP